MLSSCISFGVFNSQIESAWSRKNVNLLHCVRFGEDGFVLNEHVLPEKKLIENIVYVRTVLLGNFVLAYYYAVGQYLGVGNIYSNKIGFAHIAF